MKGYNDIDFPKEVRHQLATVPMTFYEEQIRKTEFWRLRAEDWKRKAFDAQNVALILLYVALILLLVLLSLLGAELFCLIWGHI